MSLAAAMISMMAGADVTAIMLFSLLERLTLLQP